jgi:hypothetical protein
MFSKILDLLLFACKLYSLLSARNGLVVFDLPTDEPLMGMLDVSSFKES